MGIGLTFKIVAGDTGTPVKGKNGADALADELAVDADGNYYSEGPYCRIRVTPVGQKTLAGDPVYLREVIAHEVFHCYQDQIQPSWLAQSSPDWLIEGGAEWAALQITNSPWRLAGFVDDYLNKPRKPLFTRDYDAAGFFGHVEDVTGNLWKMMPNILTEPTDELRYLAADGKHETFLNSWASSSFDATPLGPDWTMQNPVPGPSRLRQRPGLVHLRVRAHHVRRDRRGRSVHARPVCDRPRGDHDPDPAAPPRPDPGTRKDGEQEHGSRRSRRRLVLRQRQVRVPRGDGGNPPAGPAARRSDHGTRPDRRPERGAGRRHTRLAEELLQEEAEAAASASASRRTDGGRRLQRRLRRFERRSAPDDVRRPLLRLHGRGRVRARPLEQGRLRDPGPAAALPGEYRPHGEHGVRHARGPGPGRRQQGRSSVRPRERRRVPADEKASRTPGGRKDPLRSQTP